MKKSLVALAALAVVGAASAQSTVTLYGVVDMGVSALRDTNSNISIAHPAATESNKNIMKSVLSGSRLGFKGTEDLGGGLKANFLLELGLTPADSLFSGMVNRQSYVGLSGGFGEVRLGRQYTPYFNVQAAMDLYGNIDAPGYVVALHNRGRANNAVTYSTPNFGGFAGSFQIAGGEAAVIPGAQASGNSFGLSGVYAKGPLVAGIAYDSVTNPKATKIGGLTKITDGTVDIYRFGNTTSSDVNVWAAGASYDFTVVKASLAYSALTDNQNATALNTSAKSSKGWNASIAAPFGAVTVLGNLGRGYITQTGANEFTYTGYQLGANYSLSKRTTAYAVYGYDYVTEANVTGDITRRQASVGVKHTF